MRKESRITTNSIQLAQRIFVGLVLSQVFIFMPVYADSTPYQYWKKQQEQHDLRLSKKITYLNQSSAVDTQIRDPSTLKVAPPSTITVKSPRLGEQVKVNINTANAQELSAKLDSIGAKKAQAIVAYRNKHGRFKHIDDLKNVKGIGEKIYARNQLRLTLND